MVASEDSLFSDGPSPGSPDDMDEFDLPETSEPPMWSTDSSVIDLTDDNFDKLVQDGKEAPWFIEFYAPWCGHCKSLAPEWEQLAAIVESRGDKVRIAKVDATVHAQVAKDFELQGFPTLKLIEQGKVYDYDGDRTAVAMATWVAGEYASGISFSLPKDRTVVDKVKQNVKQLMDGVKQVQQYMPALIPSVFGVGFLGGLLLAYSCGFLRRSRVATLNEFFEVKVTRDEKGSAGMTIDPMTMMVMKITAEHRKMLERVNLGDMVTAVNKHSIIDSDDYLRLAHNVKEFSLTFARCGKASNGKASNGHAKKED